MRLDRGTGVIEREELELSRVVAEWMGKPWKVVGDDLNTCCARGWCWQDCRCWYAVRVPDAWEVVSRLHEKGYRVRIDVWQGGVGVEIEDEAGSWVATGKGSGPAMISGARGGRSRSAADTGRP